MAKPCGLCGVKDNSNINELIDENVEEKIVFFLLQQ